MPSETSTLLRPTTEGKRPPTGVPVSLGPPSRPMQRYDIGTPERGRQGQLQQDDMHAHEHEEIHDLFREDSHNNWESDGVNLADQEIQDLTNEADEMGSAVPG